MSNTEIFIFNKDGNAEDFADVKNSWRGAMAIWRLMEKKYLVPLTKPAWMTDDDYKKIGYSRTCVPHFGDKGPNPLKPVWDLWESNRVSRIDKIVLGTTFDNVIVMSENFIETSEAFDEFEGETSLKEQADIIRKVLEDKNVIAIAWNQTSVCGDTWSNHDYNEEKDESIPYNLNKQTGHWNLFEDLNKMN